MTIEQVIKQLQELPEEEKALQLYVCDNMGNNYLIESISVYDSEAKHGKTNPLGINYKGLTKMNKKLIISYQKEWDENGTAYRQTVKIPMELFNHINAKLKEAIKDKKHNTITDNFKHVYIKTLHKGKNYTTITTSEIVRYELEQLGADVNRYLTERNTIIEAY